MSDETPVKVLRSVPVTLSLVEVDLDGGARWVVVYETEVDGEKINAAAVVKMLGASATPKEAMQIAAQRLGPLGF